MNFIRSFSFLKLLVLFLSCLWLIWLYKESEVPMDSGDGVMHFMLSQASWGRPELFLHHWGKPLFIFLSSGFSQFGFSGMVFFNILVFFFTVILAFKILTKWKVSEWLQLLLPVVLLVAHDIPHTVAGGLTEPLFNFFLTLALFLFINQRYFFFALVISFVPFLRSEGQLVIILAGFVLLISKEFKVVPFLLTGFILYSIIGAFVLHDFWWYYTMSPYSMANDIYGKGTWGHYLLSYKNYLGNPGLLISMVGTISAFILLFRKKWDELKWKEGILVYGTFLGVVAAHSYFWANGKNGSMGLTRIATQGVVHFLIMNLYYINQLEINKKIVSVVSVILFFIFGVSLIANKNYPIKAKHIENQVIEAASFMKKHKKDGERVYYHYPLLTFEMEGNSEAKNSEFIFYYGSNIIDDSKNLFKPGDYIVRDSHFGPKEASISLDEIAKIPELVKIGEFISSEQIDDPNGETEGVMVYQFIPKNEQVKNLRLENRELHPVYHHR